MLMATVNTVLGPVDASQIGGTMSHVHLTINILCWFREPDSGVQRGISGQKISLKPRVLTDEPMPGCGIDVMRWTTFLKGGHYESHFW